MTWKTEKSPSQLGRTLRPLVIKDGLVNTVIDAHASSKKNMGLLHWKPKLSKVSFQHLVKFF